MADQTESLTRRGFLATSGEGIVTAGIAWTMNTGSGQRPERVARLAPYVFTKCVMQASLRYD
jgi:hypothetical protein